MLTTAIAMMLTGAAQPAASLASLHAAKPAMSTRVVAADFARGGPVADAAGARLGQIDSAGDGMAVITTPKGARMRVPLTAFDKDARGLFLNVDQALLDKVTAQVKLTPAPAKR